MVTCTFLLFPADNIHCWTLPTATLLLELFPTPPPLRHQVKLLSAALGPSARVGTVDKFQGQEAPVVIVSLARTSFDDNPTLVTRSDDDSRSSSSSSTDVNSASGADSLVGSGSGGGSSGGGSGVGGGGGSGSTNSNALSFVLDLRRLNVALSRAQCVAVVVLSPQLSQAQPGGSLQKMKALSFACRLLEEGEKKKKSTPTRA
jgi:uncharacterized protein